MGREENGGGESAFTVAVAAVATSSAARSSRSTTVSTPSSRAIRGLARDERAPGSIAGI
ncbi:hypothetical protein [Streptomyces sp. S.PB5]|uniref:hypothetical protein n=1 Tax=Streptomyces sp. S.PB5 TaxID=3020844 RepID=UPI0025AFE9C1|nr:hypothetical protein [Streptomyces sp. S.PB5]MDN3022687.1 hypothetical protein [Streptomyces sp. S.PB5]